MNIKISDKLMYQAGQARMPISGVFELTPICNFSCKMCYLRKDYQEVEQMGGLCTVEEWLGWAEQAKSQGMLYLLLTGGEPFLYPGFWQLYEKLTKMGFVISINSNGSMITEKVAEKLTKMPPKKINITLYGASNETYEKLCGAKEAFDRVMNATDILRKHGIRYKFNCSLTPLNRHELQEMCDIAKEQGVPIEIAPYMFPPVRRIAKEDYPVRLTAEEAGRAAVESKYIQLNKDAFKMYAKSKMQFVTPEPISKNIGEGEEMGCRAGRCSFWLDWQGYMSACGMTNTPRFCLKESEFKETWQKVVEATNKARCLAQCANCPNKKICHACIATAYCETGDINGRPVYVCDMIEAEAKECRKILDKEG